MGPWALGAPARHRLPGPWAQGLIDLCPDCQVDWLLVRSDLHDEWPDRRCLD